MSDEYPPQELLDHRSEPDSRAVLEDWYHERGQPAALRPLAWVQIFAAADAADAAAVDDAAADADAVDDAAADADADAAAADAADDAAVDADADAAAADADAVDDAAADDAAVAVAARTRLTHLLREELDMHEGLKILVTPGNWYGLTQVGWLRRVHGDEWELVGARTLRRIGSPVPLAELAELGPGKTIELQPASQHPEEIHRLLIRRSIVADEAAWAKYCPKPKDWVER